MSRNGLLVSIVLLAVWAAPAGAVDGKKGIADVKLNLSGEQLAEWAKSEGLSTITLGAGCFWCTEAAFQQIDGVKRVVSGYSGGHVKNPTYEQVCGKQTGHIEVCHIFYDAKAVGLEKLLEVFFTIHDPTTKDKQGADEGPQYRSAVLYHDEDQKVTAQAMIKKLDDAKIYSRKIVTVVEPFKEFFPAEDYHQNFYNTNPRHGYCQAIVRDKVLKVRKVFADDLKTEAK